jgi:hypothetical protein
MKTKRFFSLGLPALLLALVLSGCSTGGGDPPFIAVTGISGVQFATAVGYGLRLSGTVEPANATNQTIAWSGNGVSNGVLTATSAVQYPVTATIANGTESGSYTQNFTITAYQTDTVSSGNPFGNDTSPYIVWAMDDTGGTVYVTIKNTTWEATDGGSTYNSGTYTFTDIAVVPWKVGTGYHTGDTGLAFISSGTMYVVNLSSIFSGMNGEFTKLDTSLTLDGTWVSTDALIFGNYAEMAATSGDFTVQVGPNSGSLTDKAKGTYTSTNPVVCTITHLYESGWVAWDTLSDAAKNAIGGSSIFTGLIYDNSPSANTFEVSGSTFTKQ